MIILEGPEGSGKSTLKEALLSRRPEWTSWHTGGPPKTAMELEERIEKQLAPTGKCFDIVDRFSPVSELVYGKTLRGETLVAEGRLRNRIGTAISRGAIWVYCRPSTKTLLDWVAEEKPHKDSAHISAVNRNRKAIIMAYDLLMVEIRQYGGWVIRFNRDNRDIEFLSDVARSIISIEEFETEILQELSACAG